MERLTKRETEQLSNGEECVICNYEKADCNNSCMHEWCKWSEKAIEKLKAYEDKEEQGLLIELPCKVGDTLYYIYGNEIVEVRVLRIEIAYTEIHIVTGYNSLGKIGKTLFFTRSEAEEALARMKGE